MFYLLLLDFISQMSMKQWNIDLEQKYLGNFVAHKKLYHIRLFVIFRVSAVGINLHNF